MRNIFRYQKAAIGMMLGMTLAFLGILLADFSIQLRTQEEADRNQFQYTQQYLFSIQTQGTEAQYADMAAALKAQPLVVMAENASLYVDSERAEHLCKVVFSMGEPLKYHMISGNYPSEAELQTGELVAILGRELRKNVHSIQGVEYLTICGEEYRVIGYCSGEHTTVSNYSILLFGNCLGAQTAQALMEWGNTGSVSCSLSSDCLSEQELRQQYLAMCNLLETNGMKTQGLLPYISQVSGGNYRASHLRFAILIYIFSVFVTGLVMQYWLWQRTYEIYVRRIYGYTKLQTSMYLLQELLIRMLFSIIAALAIYGGIQVILYAIYHVYMLNLACSLIHFAGMLMVMILAVFAYIVCFIYRKVSLSAQMTG